MDSKVLVRPVLRPDPQTVGSEEIVPWDKLPADLMIQAVREILGSGSIPGAMPSVRVVNVSLGDPLAQFDTIPSAWARAIDWLSHEFNTLFIVSAGNHPGAIGYDVSEDDLKAADGPERDRLTSQALAGLSSTRRLLPPAESLNAITVGAIHQDAAGDEFETGYNIDLWGSDGHPSPATAHGRGIRRAIKPDLAAAGGRQLYSALYGAEQGSMAPARGTALPPGVLVAAPPDKQAYVSGTTFAAAEVTRRAAGIIESLRSSPNHVDDQHVAVAAKALLVHGSVLPAGRPYEIETDRLLGNGVLVRDLALGCLPSQATILMYGDIAAGQSTDLVVPFPEAVAGLTVIRRVSMTVAWFSPINWNHRQYRRAKLMVEGPKEIPSKANIRTNIGPDYQRSHRGTVQHRAFETTRAFPAHELTFTVTCAGQAGGFKGTVPFALAVSLEVGAGVAVDVYDLVATELRVRQQIR